MRKKMLLESILIITLLLSGVAFANADYTAVITEEWATKWTKIEFTVTNNHVEDDITNFAVGNLYASGASLSESNSDWYATVIKRTTVSGQWSTDDSNNYNIDWLNNSTNGDLLAGEKVAFYYEAGDDGGITADQTWDGFFGLVPEFSSPYAVQWEDGQTYASDTTVPIPGAMWLLGSGLIGIVGVRRKFKQ